MQLAEERVCRVLPLAPLVRICDQATALRHAPIFSGRGSDSVPFPLRCKLFAHRTRLIDGFRYFYNQMFRRFGGFVYRTQCNLRRVGIDIESRVRI
jgi:hypothetical protein